MRSYIKYKDKIYIAVDSRAPVDKEVLAKESKVLSKISSDIKSAISQFESQIGKIKDFAGNEYDNIRKNDGYESNEIYKQFQKLSYAQFRELKNLL